MNTAETKEVTFLDSHETPLGCKVVERVRVHENGLVELSIVLIGPEARLSIAPDWQREQGRVWR